MNLHASISQRLERLTKLNADPALQVLALETSRRDVRFWFNEFVWTVDPREPMVALPFNLFPQQEAALEWIAAREAGNEDGIIEKSRDVGMTWLACGYAVHGWLFRPGVRFGFGSRKLEYVDDSENDKSIFAKLRYILEHLPWWMKPRKYLSKYLLLKNYDTDSSIAGEGGESIGRGDRTTVYFVDEAAFLSNQGATDAALSNTTNVRIDISSANGVGNSFYRRRMSGAIPVLTLHWRDDPRHNGYEIVNSDGAVMREGNGAPPVVPEGARLIYPWYEKIKAKVQDDVIVASEVDIDYAASIEGVCIPAKWVMAGAEMMERLAQDATLRAQMESAPGIRASIDVAGGGANRNVLGFLQGCVLLDSIKAWRHESQDTVAQWTREACEEIGVQSLVYDAGGGYGGGVADMARDPEHPPKFRIGALQGGHPPSDLEWPDVLAVEEEDASAQKLTSADKFLNARAEWWWLLRERFRKTWEVLHNDGDYPVYELIAIPRHTDLMTDLSKPTVSHTTTRKIVLESKEAMRKRGVASPDYGDMLAMLMAPPEHCAWKNQLDTFMELMG